MATQLSREQVSAVFAAFEAKDIEKVMALFTDDAVVIDPHYAVVRMKGKAAIREGLAGAFRDLAQPGFTLVNFWANEQSCAVEMDTHHRLSNGREIKFPQVFIVEMRDGLVTRLQAYEPYGPHGILNIILGVRRLRNRLAGNSKPAA
jgi:ketosteroid isomerase-like protein